VKRTQKERKKEGKKKEKKKFAYGRKKKKWSVEQSDLVRLAISLSSHRHSCKYSI
jgi:hypothetical protein